MPFALLEPLRELFKDEVRRIGVALRDHDWVGLWSARTVDEYVDWSNMDAKFCANGEQIRGFVMELFRIKKDIPFMRHALVFNVLSLITFLLAIFFLISRGLHLSVEFTGGTLVEVRYEQAANLDSIRTSLRSADFKDLLVQNFGSPQNVLIRVPLAGEGKKNNKATKSWRLWMRVRLVLWCK